MGDLKTCFRGIRNILAEWKKLTMQKRVATILGIFFERGRDIVKKKKKRGEKNEGES